MPPRTSKQVMAPHSPDRIPQISAHRGGPMPGFPENCIETFENTLKHVPAMLEMDVSTSADGVLFLLHDNSLDRTTSGTGRADSKSWEYIRSLKLKDQDGELTAFSPPGLEDVLRWNQTQQAILYLDVKRGTSFEEVVELVQQYEAQPTVVVIVYNIQDAQRVHRIGPELTLSVNVRNEEELAWLRSSGIPLNKVHAFTGTSEKKPALYEALHEAGVWCILGTMGNLDSRAARMGDHFYQSLIQSGADILATDRPVQAGRAIWAEVEWR